MANTAVVCKAASSDCGCSEDSTTTKNNTDNDSEKRSDSSFGWKDVSNGMQVVRKSLEAQGISEKARDIILQSWRPGTYKQYSSYINRWKTYCCSKQISYVSPTLPEALDFLVSMFESGVGYSGINTARSALSCVIKPVNGVSFGSQPTVARFLKGVFQSRPSIPRYSENMGCWNGVEIP